MIKHNNSFIHIFLLKFKNLLDDYIGNYFIKYLFFLLFISYFLTESSFFVSSLIFDSFMVESVGSFLLDSLSVHSLSYFVTDFFYFMWLLIVVEPLYFLIVPMFLAFVTRHELLNSLYVLFIVHAVAYIFFLTSVISFSNVPAFIFCVIIFIIFCIYFFLFEDSDKTPFFTQRDKIVIPIIILLSLYWGPHMSSLIAVMYVSIVDVKHSSDSMSHFYFSSTRTMSYIFAVFILYYYYMNSMLFLVCLSIVVVTFSIDVVFRKLVS